MTPFRNDEGNPFSRESVWPRMPQTPLHVAPTRPTPSRYAPPRDRGIAEALVVAGSAWTPARPRRRVRLTPFIGAAAVGAAGLLTLFLVIGTGPRP